MIVNANLAWTSACWIYYDRGSSTIWLASDNTSTWSSVALGSSAVIQNSQCSVTGSGASVSASGTSFTVKIPITFKTAFKGTKNIFMDANNSNGTSTSLVSEGTWTVQ